MATLARTLNANTGTHTHIKKVANFQHFGFIAVVVTRGGFRISSRGWQSFFQGVAKISQWVAKKSHATPLSLSVFLLFYTTLLVSAHFFDILDTQNIAIFYFFLCVPYLLNANLIPCNVLGLGEVETPSNGQGVARGTAQPPEIASGCNYRNVFFLPN